MRLDLRGRLRLLLRKLRPFKGTPWSEIGTWAAWLAGWALVGVPVVWLSALVLPWWAAACGWAGLFVLGLGGYGSMLAWAWPGVLGLSAEGKAR